MTSDKILRHSVVRWTMSRHGDTDTATDAPSQISSRSDDKKRVRPRRSKAKGEAENIEIDDPRPRRLVHPLTFWKNTTSDLVQLQDLYFPVPDTYSVAYQAQLLGFQVPPREYNTPCPPPDPWKVAPDDTFPDKTLIPRNNGFWSQQSDHSSRNATLDVKDPLYEQLLQSSEPTTPMNPEQMLRVLLKPQDTNSVPQIMNIDIQVISSLPPFVLEANREQISYQFAWFHFQETFSSAATTNNGNPTAGAELIMELTLITVQETDKKNLMALLCAALEHARTTFVWYARVSANDDLTQSWLVQYFDAERVPNTDCFIIDLHNTSTQLVQYRLLESSKPKNSGASPHEKGAPTRRWLARLPALDQILISNTSTLDSKQPVILHSAPKYMRNVQVCLQAKLGEENSIAITNEKGRPVEIQTNITEYTPLILLKDFELTPDAKTRRDEIADQIENMAREMRALEESLVPRAHILMHKITNERIEYEMDAPKRQQEKEITDEYLKLMELRREQDLALQQQMEQDMNAVCNVCGDGEVTPDNQILFCENCNVAVHQYCYGIDRIPEDDYFCMACRYLKKTDGQFKGEELPICCELCPFKLGAFVRTDMPNTDETGKWVHMVCAKWQGLEYLKPNEPDLVEDVTEMLGLFSSHGIVCELCEGRRGAMNKCRHDGCNKWLHVTCARASGVCNVIHGEDINGPVPENPWTLLCQDHSHMRRPEEAFTKNQLMKMAQRFPEEDMPEKYIKMKIGVHFDDADGDKRKLIFSGVDRKYEQDLITELTKNRITFRNRCEVCCLMVAYAKELFRCRNCQTVFCTGCAIDLDTRNPKITETYDMCNRCRASEQERETMQCIACSQVDGPVCQALVTDRAKKKHQKLPDDSFIGKTLWIHNVCTLWNNDLFVRPPQKYVDISQVVMPEGCSLIHETKKCLLCGRCNGLKITCGHPGCRWSIQGEMTRPYFHVTCARQAGFQIDLAPDTLEPFGMCYRHCDNAHNLRARLEDMIEHEIKRSGKKFTRAHKPMGFAHAATLLACAVNVLKTLGWAWRWTEMWVDYDSSWEPLLEPGQREEDLSREELRIVDSTRESRVMDARRCRLAAFGAALRNRLYDTEDDFDRKALDRALRSIMKTSSLVGPLQPHEIEFYVDWLSFAYRSKHRYLGFGPDKIPVASDGFCVHMEDGSPKFELGTRPLPGSQELMGRSLFETGVTEPDDFLRTELGLDERGSPRRPIRDNVVTKKRGRPRTTSPDDKPPTHVKPVVHSSTKRSEEKRETRLPKKLLDNPLLSPKIMVGSPSVRSTQGSSHVSSADNSAVTPSKRKASPAQNSMKRSFAQAALSPDPEPPSSRTPSRKREQNNKRTLLTSAAPLEELVSLQSPVFLRRNVSEKGERDRSDRMFHLRETSFRHCKVLLTEEEKTVPLATLCAPPKSKFSRRRRHSRTPPRNEAVPLWKEEETWRENARRNGKAAVMSEVLPLPRNDW